MAERKENCHCCGKPTPIDELDGKPGPGHFTPMQLESAADAGHNFDYLACATCYGPGFTALPVLV